MRRDSSMNPSGSNARTSWVITMASGFNQAALPRSESDAAGAEQRRVAEEVRRLVVALAGRVELLLDDAQRTLAADAAHARDVIARTGDNACETLTTMVAPRSTLPGPGAVLTTVPGSGKASL